MCTQNQPIPGPELIVCTKFSMDEKVSAISKNYDGPYPVLFRFPPRPFPGRETLVIKIFLTIPSKPYCSDISNGTTRAEK